MSTQITKLRAIFPALWLFILAVFFFVTRGVVSAADSVTCVFAADADSNLIRQYDLSGHQIGQITNAQFKFPTLLIFDSSTHSLITDVNFTGPEAPDLVRFDLQGNILARNTSSNIFGEQGGGIVDVADSKHGSFFVTSTLNTQIAEVDRNLQVIRRFPSGAVVGGLRILGAAVSDDGSRLFVTDADGQSENGFIRVFDADAGTQIGMITNSALGSPFLPRLSPSGLLYVSDRGAFGTQDKIVVFSQNGLLVRQFTAGATNLDDFGRFEFLPDGKLAVLCSRNMGSSIRILTSTGQLVSEFGSPGRPLAIAVGRNLCVLTNESEPFVIRTAAIGTNGMFALEWESCGSHLYEVQSSSGLSTSNGWLRRVLRIGEDGTTVWTNSNPTAADECFYRVQRFSFEGDDDQDGLSNLAEFNRGTDLQNPDTDGDGMPDGWEVSQGFSPLDPADASADLDGDGFSNIQEYQSRTRPNASYSRPANFPSGLIGWWKLDEATGTNVFDSSLNAHHGQVVGANPDVVWTTGYFSNGVTLGGPAKNWIQVPYQSSLALTQNFTLMGWVKPSAPGVLVGNFDANGSGNYLLKFAPNSVQFQFSPTGDGTGTVLQFDLNWSANDWHHIAVCYSQGTNLSVFVDGEWRVGHSVTGTINSTTNPILIGFPGLTNTFALDDVRIYNRALSTNEIASLTIGNGLPLSMIVGQTATLRAFGASDGDVCQWSIVSGQGFFTSSVGCATEFRPSWPGAVTVQVVIAKSGISQTNAAHTIVTFPELSPLSDWNDGSIVQTNNNCYNFATDIRTDTIAQPGGPPFYYLYTCSDQLNGAVADGLQPDVNIDDLCHTSGLPEGHIVALLVLPPSLDFHWVRMDADGTWSSKAGSNPATTLDNAGHLITDPRTANWQTIFGSYQFCGFFWVGPNVNILHYPH